MKKLVLVLVLFVWIPWFGESRYGEAYEPKTVDITVNSALALVERTQEYMAEMSVIRRANWNKRVS